MSAKKTGGLAGVIAGESAICTVGQGSGLNYRGYSIEALAENATFEEVAYLLQYGELPNMSELSNYKNALIKARSLPEKLKNILENIPKDAHPMDVMRTGCSALGTLEPESDFTKEQDRVIVRLLGIFPSILLYWHHFHKDGTRLDTKSDEDTIAGYFLEKLHDKTPSEDERRCMHVSLILYAEHEFNASTFAARICASTLSDTYSTITTGISVLRGPLHGGANEAAMKLIDSFSSVEDATKGVYEMLEAKQLLMGFGHRVYGLGGDPRSPIIKSWSKKLGGNTDTFKISETIEEIMKKEKPQLPTNADFFSASAYRFLNIPTDYFTPVFIMSRTSGWAAHVKEQRSNNKLIRPSSEYTGPDNRAYVALEKR
ncbi:MAG: citrate/2-methylcitrate synthase [Sulfurospirillaceae bacterium]|nr:citrate/2-methylcitrate synthase [Sulfurospirillaceae bacterium]